MKTSKIRDGLSANPQLDCWATLEGAGDKC